MNRLRWLAAAVTVAALALTSAPATAGSDRDRHHSPSRIDLPNGWQPEGITTDGRSLYVGSLADGAIWKASPRSGRGRILADGATGRVAVGVDYDRWRDLLWVAGGPTGEVRAQDARTGEVVATYSFGEGRFLNDLVVTQHAVYVTDSFSAELAVVPLHRRHLPRPGQVRTLPLTGDFSVVPDAFNLNGIVAGHRWLIAVQSVNGRLFRIDPRTGDTHRIKVRGARLVNGDGLELSGDVLYVVRNQNNKVVALDLNRWLTKARRVAVLRSPDLDVPTTAAALGRSLWVVNARFNTDPTPQTPYWVTRLHAVGDHGSDHGSHHHGSHR
jgi:hypothetical protein